LFARARASILTRTRGTQAAADAKYAASGGLAGFIDAKHAKARAREAAKAEQAAALGVRRRNIEEEMQAAGGASRHAVRCRRVRAAALLESLVHHLRRALAAS
jgi:hypothetical protein